MDDATASDNCGEITKCLATTAGDAAGNYVIIRTFRPPTTLETRYGFANHHRGHHSPEFTFVPADYTVSVRRDANGRRHGV